MKQVILCLSAAVVLAGCTAAGPTRPIAPAPVCEGAAQCGAEWDAARAFVLAHAAFKIETYSRDFMQTFNSTDDSTGLGASVNKEPDGAGRYRIVAAFACDNIFGCIPNQWDTLDQFNKAVAAAGAQAPGG